MRKIWYRNVLIVLVILSSLLCIHLYKIQFGEDTEEAVTGNENSVIVGGIPVGIYLETDGILVLDTQEIEDCHGTVLEPAKRLVKAGDYILAINGREVSGKNELMDEVSHLTDQDVTLTLKRNGETIQVQFQSVEVELGVYKLGIWIRDSVQGLGMVTYFTEENEYGALGHGIHDIDTDVLLEIENGALYDVNVVGVQKGEPGTPGGLEGVIIYKKSNLLGTVEKNSESGIYGKIEDIKELCNEEVWAETCSKKDIQLGPAVIRCSLGGKVKEYDIEIRKVDYITRNENKGIVIEVVDKELIKETGGIVQGMSGSPIIQNGKLVGAVTHVLVNDPTRGYGIFIENMLQH